jgi:hypothetical protein
MTRAHRVAINLPKGLHDYVQEFADHEGISVTTAVTLIIAAHRGLVAEYYARQAAGPKSKTTKGKSK